MFNSDRRFYEKLQDTGTYLDSIAEHETLTEVYTVEDLLKLVLLRKSWVRGLNLSPSSPWGCAILELPLKFLQFLFQYSYPLINGIFGQVDVG